MISIPHRNILNNRLMREYLILIGILCLFFQFKYSSVSFFKYLPFVVGLGLWINTIFTIRKQKELLVLLALAFYGLLMFLIGKGSLQYIVVYVPFGMALLKVKISNWRIWIVSALIISITVMVDWSKSPNQYYLYDGMSRNYVSVFALYSLLVIAVTYNKRGKECPFIPVIIAWIMSLSAFGRGGILALTTVFVLFACKWGWSREYAKGNKHHKRMFAFLVLIIGLIIFGYTQRYYLETNYLRRFFGYEASYLNSNVVRTNMIKEYIDYCFNHPLSFFLGANATDFSGSSTNMHNSFLQIHSQFGLIGIMFYIYMFFKAAFSNIRMKNYDYLILIIGIAIRGMTDWCFPAFPIDAFLLYFFFETLFAKEYKQIKNRTSAKGHILWRRQWLQITEKR